jgi:hypothetical protein
METLFVKPEKKIEILSEEDKRYEVHARGGHFIGRYATLSEVLEVIRVSNGIMRVRVPNTPDTLPSMDSIAVGVARHDGDGSRKC